MPPFANGDEEVPDDLLKCTGNPEVFCKWMVLFVAEVRRQDGEKQPPKTIYATLTGQLRYCRDIDENALNFMDTQDRTFKTLHTTSEQEMAVCRLLSSNVKEMYDSSIVSSVLNEMSSIVAVSRDTCLTTLNINPSVTSTAVATPSSSGGKLCFKSPPIPSMNFSDCKVFIYQGSSFSQGCDND